MEDITLQNVRAALAIAEDKRKLEQRLRGAVFVLVNELRPRFKRARFDFANKRLVGDGFVLQWRLRPNPSAPESYTNQQTNRGTVVCLAVALDKQSGELV